VQLTTTQVSLIAALIAPAAPAITYRATARLDRDPWVRQRRAEVRVLSADLFPAVREELKQDRDPCWRRTRRAA
jgi:hypothetical protein